MKEKLIIVGTSTTAHQAYDFVKYHGLYDVVGFAVDREYYKESEFMGMPVYELEKLDEIPGIQDTFLFIAMLWNKLNKDRKDVYYRLKSGGGGYRFANLISPTAVIRGKLKGDNCWIHDYVVIQSDAEIGTNCMIMAHTLIGAYVSLGDHCFCGARSVIGGGASVGSQTFVGINCVVYDETKVGSQCILGACGAIKRNVADRTIVKPQASYMESKSYPEDVIESKLMYKCIIR